MKGLILYFSGTGNTKYIAKCIQQEFFDSGCFTDLISIENSPKINLDKYDFLVIGSPKYYECVPFFFLKWIKKNFPNSKNIIKTILFCTGTSPTNTSFSKLSKILKDKNCEIVATKTFQMPNNYLIGIYKNTVPNNCEKYSVKGCKKARELVNNFLIDISSIEKINPIIGLLCENISKTFCKSSRNKAKSFSVSVDCSKCNRCVNACPTNNIKIVNNRINFKNKCILCTRCLNICPKNSILYKNKKITQYKYHLKLLDI